MCSKCGQAKPLVGYSRCARAPDGRAAECKACIGERVKAWRKANPERDRAAQARSRVNNHERILDAKRAYRDANRDLIRRKDREAWERRPVEIRRVYALLYKRVQRKATPPWADRDAIKALYVEAQRRRVWGEDVHVDHFYPLRSKLVCGLHTPANLRIVDSGVNMRKSNLMPESEETW